MRLTLAGVTKRFGGAAVIDALDLSVGDGEMLALLGPSGCGKSTTLFAICGIHRVDGGEIRFGERDVTETRAQDRNVGVVFQNYALYPHMTAAENIAFPLTVKREAKDQIARKVAEIAGLVRISELLERRPSQLSGGQQQRVALARALVREPDILLLDEPLANLDAKLRMEMRAEIRRVQVETGITAILVTHDQVEAMSMSDRIAIMNAGRIVQVAAPAAMYEAPADMFVAGFLGNPPIAFLEAEAAGGAARLRNGQSVAWAGEGPVVLGVRPEHFGPQHGTGLAGTVAMMETHGREDLFQVDLGGGGQLRAILPAGSGIRAGDRVDWGVAAEKLLAFRPDGSRA